MTHSFVVGALAEYLEAVQFYEENRAGLGTALVEEFERVIELVGHKPQAWKQVHASGIRRIGLSRFPYAVFYRVLADDQIQVTAFAHHRRRPGYWLARTTS